MKWDWSHVQVRDFTSALVTYMFDEDPIKNKGGGMSKTFFRKSLPRDLGRDAIKNILHTERRTNGRWRKSH